MTSFFFCFFLPSLWKCFCSKHFHLYNFISHIQLSPFDPLEAIKSVPMTHKMKFCCCCFWMFTICFQFFFCLLWWVGEKFDTFNTLKFFILRVKHPTLINSVLINNFSDFFLFEITFAFIWNVFFYLLRFFAVFVSLEMRCWYAMRKTGLKINSRDFHIFLVAFFLFFCCCFFSFPSIRMKRKVELKCTNMKKKMESFPASGVETKWENEKSFIKIFTV